MIRGARSHTGAGAQTPREIVWFFLSKSLVFAVIELSQKFWKSLERADSKGMREVSDPDCWFVHIGMSCGLDEEMEALDKKLFQPTRIDIHGQEVREWGDTSICMTDVDYSLLLDGKETTHHFMTTEVYQHRNGEWRLIQFTFTALVN